jgi:hypothetical protein
MADWRKLEADFREIPDPFSQMRADWSHLPGEPDSWRIEACTDYNSKERFETLASVGGKMLLSSSGAKLMCSSDLLKEPNHFRRWLNSLKELTGSFKHGPIGIDLDERDRPVSKIYTGTVEKVVEASALLCLKLSAEEEVSIARASVKGPGEEAADGLNVLSERRDRPEKGASQKSRLDNLVDRAKNNPKVAVLLFLIMILIGIGTLTDSLDKIISFGEKYIINSDIDVVDPSNKKLGQATNTIQAKGREPLLREKSARELLESLDALPPLQAEQIAKQSYIGHWVRWEGKFYTIKSAEENDETVFYIYACHPDGHPPWIAIVFSGKWRSELEQLRRGDHIQFEAKITQIGNNPKIGVVLSEGKLVKINR